MSADQYLEPTSTSARTNEAKRNDLRSLVPKWPIGGIPAPVCETGQTDLSRTVLPAHLLRYEISHSSGIRTCTGRAVRRTVAFCARGASAGRNVGNVAQPAGNCREHVLAWRKRRVRIAQCCRDELADELTPRAAGLPRIRTKGDGHAPVPRSPHLLSFWRQRHQ